MKHPFRIYQIMHSEKISTPNGVKTIRICAITDGEKYRLAKLNDEPIARIEIQDKGNSYIVLEKFYNKIANAVAALPAIIEENKSTSKSNYTIDDLLDM